MAWMKKSGWPHRTDTVECQKINKDNKTMACQTLQNSITEYMCYIIKYLFSKKPSLYCKIPCHTKHVKIEGC